MVTVLQVLGLAYILMMVYLSFLYYKKNNYSVQSFIFWVVVWCFGGVLLAFPESSSIITQRLKIVRVLDFYLIAGLMFFSVVCFLNYATVQRTEKKVDELVRRIAIDKPRKK
jgi:hypothetical protein